MMLASIRDKLRTKRWILFSALLTGGITFTVSGILHLGNAGQSFAYAHN